MGVDAEVGSRNGDPAVSNALIAGLDLGSTGVKILISDSVGNEVLVRQLPTPWISGPGGTTSMTADDLITTVTALLDAVAKELMARHGDTARVEAIAVSGMGESGVLVDSDGSAVTSAIAWFDPRGQQQVDELPESIASQFAGRTGLPLGVQVSVIKLLHLRDKGVELAGTRWLNLPEFVVTALGGDAVSEYSLASRTGLLDQDTATPWVSMLDYLGVDENFLPPLINAGTRLGTASSGAVPEVFRGAILTVAGHDHLVSAVSSGDFPADRFHVSMGTAEVLLRMIEHPLPFDTRERLAHWLINCVRHVVPGTWVLVAGVKTGLVMRRMLQLYGVNDREGRDALDEQVMALPLEGNLQRGDIEVSGARNDDGVLKLTVHADGASPAEVFGAALRHGNDELQVLIDAMDREIPPAQSSLLTGGWASMRAVQRARAAVLPRPEVSTRSQDTAYGAALFARRLLDQEGAATASSSPTR
jgi:sugar (pentulose or hexulose) kinase